MKEKERRVTSVSALIHIMESIAKRSRKVIYLFPNIKEKKPLNFDYKP